MQLPKDTHKKMMSLYNLLSEGSISLGSFGYAATILRGIHPDLDDKLDKAEKALDALQKVMEGDIITLSAEHLPEKDDKQKKKKRALIFFITSLKNLQSEMKRIDAEFSQSNASSENTAWHIGRIIKFAKGPFGLITLVALVIVGLTIMMRHSTLSGTRFSSPTKSFIQVITYQGKQLPLSGLYVGHGPDCDSPHYHATGGVVIALDGTHIIDPEGCGFGKVQDVQVQTVQQ